VPFDEVVGGIRGVDVHGDTVATGRDLGICFGDEAPNTFSDRQPTSRSTSYVDAGAPASG